MRIHLRRRVHLLAATSVLGLFSTSLPAHAAEAGAAAGAAPIGEVIVTAQRREQNLQQVPVSVTALTQDTLQANRVVDVRDLSALAPNLTVREPGGGVLIPSYTLRGYGAQSSSTGVDRGIALYFDGVYMQNLVGSIFQLADIERVEVLKGPQGTLFGRNVTGGAISFTTREPKGEFGFEQTFTFGNYNQLVSKTRVDLPAFGRLKAAITYAHSERDGDIRNLGAGTTWDYGPASGGRWGKLTSPKRMGNHNTEAVLFSARLDVTDDLSLSYKGDYTQDRYTPQGYGVVQLNNPTGNNLAILTGQPTPIPLSPRRPDAVNAWWTIPGYLYQWGHNLTATWDANEHLSFKNILSKRKGHTEGSSQFDGLGGLVNTVPALGPVGQPFIAVTSTTLDDSHQWSEEFIGSLDYTRLHLTAGYLHFENFEQRGLPGVGSVQASRVMTNFVVPGSTTAYTQNKAVSDAFYVQPEFHVTDSLDLIAGYRLTMDKKNERVVAVSGAVQAARYEKKKPTYLVGVNYKLNDDIFTYAKYSTGYISGGTINTATYSPETSRSYEVGVKSYFFDRRLRSNLAVFSVKYRALQISTFASNVGLPAALGTIVANASDGKAKGFEWENVLVPARGLTLTANIGYTDFTLSNTNPTLGPPQFTYPGYRPKWTGNGAVQYEIPGVMGDARLVMRVDANYKSKEYEATFNLTPNILDALTIQPTWIVNARVALADLKVWGGSAQVALWGRNLTDDDHPITGGVLSGLDVASAYQRARTYGIDLSFKY